MLEMLNSVMVAVGLGLGAGLLHVWSGPDHLAAVAPLAVQQKRRPWLAGGEWGLGHSTGVALVGLLFLCFKHWLPVEAISSWSERLVGVMLIGIGLWGFYKALHTRIHQHEHEHDGHRHSHWHWHGRRPARLSKRPHRHWHAAFGVGTLHGLAGSSHFLGVLPAMAFAHVGQAIAYIASFAIGTILAMALFAGAMGGLGRFFTQGQRFKHFLMTCSGSAIGVGVYWLFTAAHA